MGTVTPLTVTGEIIPGQALKARRELESMLHQIDRSTFDLGDQLYLIKKNGFYVGYTTFSEYIRSYPDLIKPRKAEYLVRIALVMDVLGIPREQYEPVGISKLREITSLDPDGTWHDPESNMDIPLSVFIKDFVFHKAKEMHLDEIKKHVKTLKGLVGDNAMKRKSFWVSQQVDQETIMPAVELARRQIGSTHKDDEGMSQDAKDGACWEVIAISFLNDPANDVLGG